jgi:outer membrane protein OmpA-like peptidoglycan-associated protein
VTPGETQHGPQPVAPAPVGGPAQKAPINGANQPSTLAPQFAPQPQQPQANQPRRNGVTPLQAGAIGVGVGIVGGMIIGSEAHRLEDVQSQRRTVEQNGATYYSEPGRVIVREGDGLYIRHDETERFREPGANVRVEQRGHDNYQIVDRPDHSEIITVTDANGQLLKRIRRLPNGTEIILIDNTFRPEPRHYSDEVVVIPAPTWNVPPDQYDVDAASADETQIYDTLIAPPASPLPRRYTLDEVRNSRTLRQYVRSVDLTTITFATGSWTVEDSDIARLQGVADAMNRAIRANPNEIFLIEGHTDAVGSDIDNLSLSDRRAQSVASILTRNFNVPPENLTTQGYGSQFLKVQTSDAERANRRVTVRRVTPLIASGTH